MMHQLCYVIRAKEALRKAMSAYKSELADVLLEPEVITQTEPDRASWSRGDRALQIKILFLAWLRSEYGDTDEWKGVLGDEVVQVGDFDRYWELEVYTPDDVGWLLRQVEKRNIGMSILPTGSAVVDEWASRTLGGGGVQGVEQREGQLMELLEPDSRLRAGHR
jgi:hypothetical protein